MDFEIQPYPEFSWSISRRKIFKECPRKYYYHYYASHNGWLDEAPEEARIAYRLKKLITLELLAGQELHKAFANTIEITRRQGSVPAAEDIIRRVFSSLNKAYNTDKYRGKETVRLFEFYYSSGPSTFKITKLNERIRRNVVNFLHSQSFREACHSPRIFVKDPDRIDSFQLDGITVYAAPDLIYKSDTRLFRVVDWKTGQQDDAVRDQLLVYCLYLVSQDYYENEKVEAVAEYLDLGKSVVIDVSPIDILKQKRYIADSIKRMYMFLEDIEKNIPKPKESFPLRDDRDRCKYCNFWELCESDDNVAGPFK